MMKTRHLSYQERTSDLWHTIRIAYNSHDLGRLGPRQLRQFIQRGGIRERWDNPNGPDAHVDDSTGRVYV